MLIVADDLGYGDLGCYGSSAIETPELDGLAADGMRLTDAHAPGALCIPTRYGLMTGRYPFRSPLRLRDGPVVEDGPTLASVLRDAGYATSMVGKWHLGLSGDPRRDEPLTGGPCDRGFQRWFGIPASLDIPPYYWIRGRRPVAAPTERIGASSTEGWTKIQGAFWREGDIAPGFVHDDVLPRLADEAVTEIERLANAAEPFFVYVALTGPHTPWLPDAKHENSGGAGMYGDFVRMVDSAVGRILAALEKSGRADDTLVVFTSDNGPVWYPQDTERFGHASTGPLRGMKADAWEGGHRVPFIVRWPGVTPQASTRADTICLTDLMATFAVAAGTTLPEGAGQDSIDLVPMLRDVVLDTPLRETTILKHAASVVRHGRWKLIDHLGSGGFSSPRKRPPEDGEPDGQLYDLEADLGETHNLWSERPDVVKELLRRRDEIRAQSSADSTTPRTPKPTVRVPAPRETLAVTPVEDPSRAASSSPGDGTSSVPIRVAAIGGAGPLHPPRVDPPNFVIVLADDLGYGDLSCYDGWVQTPQLDRMAAEGLRFTDFHSSGLSCSPTRCGLLTGRYQERAGIAGVVNADPEHPDHGLGLRDEEQTFAELLGGAGYRTALFGKWHLGYSAPFFPTRHGFHEFEGFVSGNIDYHSHLDRMGTADWYRGEERVEREGYLTDLITALAVEFIEEHAERPFCLYVAHGAVHSPLQARDSGPVRGPEANATPAPDRSQRETVRAMTEALDESVGAMLGALRRLQLAERTFVFFFSDNGGAGHMDNGPLRGRKGQPWEGGHRVPAIAWWPGTVPAGVTSDSTAISLDLMPTLLDFAGLEPDPSRPLDGTSLRSLLQNGTLLPPRMLFWAGKAVREGPWKLVSQAPGLEGPALFHLGEDLGESLDRASEAPERVAHMLEALDAWRESVAR